MTTQQQRRPAHQATAAPSRPAPTTRLVANIDPLRVLRRHMLWIVGSVIVGAGLGYAAHVLCAMYYPLYAGAVTFEIQPGVRESREVGATEIANDQLAFRLANTETMLLLQRDILERAMNNQDILRTEWHKQFVTQDETGRETFNIQNAVDELEKTLSASVVRSTNFFQLHWRTHVARDVPVVLNSIAAAYMQRRKDIDDAVWNSNVVEFQNALTRTTNELGLLEVEIRQFIINNQITGLDNQRYNTPAHAAEQLTSQITTVSAALAQTSTSLAQTALKLVGTMEPTAEDIHEAEQDPIVSSQIRLVTDLKTSRRSLVERGFQPGHSQVREVESQLRAAELELEAKREEVMKRNLNARYKMLNDQRESYEQLLANLQDDVETKDEVLITLAAAHAQYQGLEVRRNRLEAQRDNDMALLREIQMIRVRADAARVRIAQNASLPRFMAFPKIHIMVPLGVLVMLALTVGVIFLRELTDQRIKSASDVAVLPGARVLGVVPDVEDDPTKLKSAELVVLRHPRSVLAESYRQTCAAMMRAIQRSGHQTVVFLGGLPGAGTTTAVTNVAATLGASGMSVLLIDANFRRPRLAKSLDLPPDAPGLGDFLAGQVKLDDAIRSMPGVETGISVMSAGTPANLVFERLNNGKFESLVAEARQRFDVILFDAPPAVVAGDAMVLANLVDAAVLVVRANQEQRGLVARLIHQLSDAHCEPLGILLNRARGTVGGYFKKNFETMAEYSSK